MTPPCWRRAAVVARIAAILGLLAASTLVAGCGRPTPTVSGKVLYRQQPLTTGEVSIIAADGKSRSGLIGTDGRYEITDAPLGPVQIVVSARKVEGGPAGGSPLSHRSGPARRPVVQSLIPPRYGDPTTSGLTCEVVAGKQTRNIDLAD